MHLIQILLPLYDNEGQEFPQGIYRDIGEELLARFTGLTAYTRAPAEGLWAPGGQGAKRDDIAVFEVMAPEIDQVWWTAYRQSLERRLRPCRQARKPRGADHHHAQEPTRSARWHRHRYIHR